MSERVPQIRLFTLRRGDFLHLKRNLFKSGQYPNEIAWIGIITDILNAQYALLHFCKFFETMLGGQV